MLVVAACGGNSNDNSSVINGRITSVTVTCNPTTINSTETSQCNASVGCTGKSCYMVAVNWSSSAGSINSSGLFTPPATDMTVQVTITATSVQDPSKSGMAIVTVNP